MSHPLHPPPDRSIKIPHLVFALLFLGLVAIWVLGASGRLGGEELAILGPGVLVAAGVVGLVASLAGARNRGSSRSTRPDAAEHIEHAEPAPATYPDTDTTQEIR